MVVKFPTGLVALKQAVQAIKVEVHDFSPPRLRNHMESLPYHSVGYMWPDQKRMGVDNTKV